MTYAPDQFNLADSFNHVMKCSFSSVQSQVEKTNNNATILARETRGNHSLGLRTTHRQVPFPSNNNRIHPISRKTVKRAYRHRSRAVQLDGSDPSEPLFISTWLTTMKPLMTPLSPRNDGSVDFPINKQFETNEVLSNLPLPSRMSLPIASSPTYTAPNIAFPVWVAQENTENRCHNSESVLPDVTIPQATNRILSSSSLLTKMRLPIAPSPINTPPNSPFPVWVAQENNEDDCHNPESVLPDVSVPPATSCVIKSSPNSSPAPEQHPNIQESCNTSSKPNSLLLIPNADHEAVQSSLNYSLEVSGSSCHLVKLNINSSKGNHHPTSPVVSAPSVAEGNREETNSERREDVEKRTRVTIEIETGGECIIFLPVDRVEYRVVARECPECSNKQKEKSAGRKPTVMVETKR
ncbi:uncharacterized protein [Centruroides vittatus]